MTPEEIKKQILGSAGVSEDAESLYEKAEATMDAEDYVSAFQFAKRSADKGLAKAQLLVGRCYISGCGTAEDAQAARIYFEKGSDGGDPDSKSWLAMMSIWGYAPDIDSSRAARLLQEAVEAGCVDEAFANLGVLHLEGRGVEKDPSQAVVLFKEGVSRGDLTAVFQLASCYALGVGIDKNLTRALELARAAEEKGFHAAPDLIAKIQQEMGTQAEDGTLHP